MPQITIGCTDITLDADTLTLIGDSPLVMTPKGLMAGKKPISELMFGKVPDTHYVAHLTSDTNFTRNSLAVIPKLLMPSKTKTPPGMPFGVMERNGKYYCLLTPPYPFLKTYRILCHSFEHAVNAAFTFYTETGIATPQEITPLMALSTQHRVLLESEYPNDKKATFIALLLTTRRLVTFLKSRPKTSSGKSI